MVRSNRFIEGDLSAYFDKIDHSILLDILRQDFHDNRLIRLTNGSLNAGYYFNGNSSNLIPEIRKVELSVPFSQIWCWTNWISMSKMY